MHKPINLALILAIDTYEALSPLYCAVNDGEVLSGLLRFKLNFEVELLRNEACTAARVTARLREYGKRLRDGDIFLLFFAGHGVCLDDDDYYCMYGADWTLLMDQSPGNDVISYRYLRTLTDKWDSRVRKAFILDNCREVKPRNLETRRVGVGPAKPRREDELKVYRDGPPIDPETLGILFSCQTGQLAQELRNRGHGLFSLALKDEIEENLTLNKPLIFGSELKERLGQRMHRLRIEEGLDAEQSPLLLPPEGIHLRLGGGQEDRHDQRVREALAEFEVHFSAGRLARPVTECCTSTLYSLRALNIDKEQLQTLNGRLQSALDEQRQAEDRVHDEKLMRIARQHPSKEAYLNVLNQSRTHEHEDEAGQGLNACSVWEEACRRDTLTAYADYRRRFPQGPFIDEAERRHADLEQSAEEDGRRREQAEQLRLKVADEAAWEIACELNTEASYAAYLGEPTRGIYRAEAEKRHQSLRDERIARENRAAEDAEDEAAWQGCSAIERDNANPDDEKSALQSYADRYALHRDDALWRIGEIEQEQRSAQQTLLQSADEASWEKTCKLNTEESYAAYTGKQPQGAYREEAERRRELLRDERVARENCAREEAEDEAAWQECSVIERSKARPHKKKAALQSYVDRYEQHRDEALSRIGEIEQEQHNAELSRFKAADETSWKKACGLNTENAFGDYLSEQPEGAYREEANRLRKLRHDERISNEMRVKAETEDEAAWKKARDLDTKEAYAIYLRKQTQGAYREKAADEVSWKKACGLDTEEAYAAYLGEQTRGAYREKAEKRHIVRRDDRIARKKHDQEDAEDQAACNKACELDTEESYAAYLAEHTHGAYRVEVERLHKLRRDDRIAREKRDAENEAQGLDELPGDGKIDSETPGTTEAKPPEKPKKSYGVVTVSVVAVTLLAALVYSLGDIDGPDPEFLPTDSFAPAKVTSDTADDWLKKTEEVERSDWWTKAGVKPSAEQRQWVKETSDYAKTKQWPRAQFSLAVMYCTGRAAPDVERDTAQCGQWLSQALKNPQLKAGSERDNIARSVGVMYSKLVIEPAKNDAADYRFAQALAPGLDAVQAIYPGLALRRAINLACFQSPKDVQQAQQALQQLADLPGGGEEAGIAKELQKTWMSGNVLCK